MKDYKKKCPTCGESGISENIVLVSDNFGYLNMTLKEVSGQRFLNQLLEQCEYLMQDLDIQHPSVFANNELAAFVSMVNIKRNLTEVAQ